MKKLLHIKILVAIVLCVLFTNSVYSQNIISSVNAIKNVTDISEKLINKKVESIPIKLTPDNWMSNKNYLITGSSTKNLKIMMAVNERIVETNSEMEDWMIERNNWYVSNPMQVVDQLKEIEEWMLAESFWTINKENEPIEIENWMTDKRFWVIEE